MRRKQVHDSRNAPLAPPVACRLNEGQGKEFMPGRSMQLPTIERLGSELAGLDASQPDYASRAVDGLLAAAEAAGASDIHLQPTAAGLELKFRVDGVLLPVAVFPAALAANIIARLKVQADLLTYHTDRPQEGRIRAAEADVEMRVSTFPTLQGERAVVRLFGGSRRYQRLEDLGLPDDVLEPLRTLLGETSGAILVSGPAGSGKTTTLYACLRELARQTAGQRSLVSIEDPIEVAVEGVAQSQVRPAAGLDLAVGLRFLMRQDPEVIMVGEIRDRATAEAALQASLTGHLVLSTFHAGSAAETVGRLLDMAVEPYVLRSGLLAVVNQRLLRRLCECAEATDDAAARLGLPVSHVKVPARLPGLPRHRLPRAVSAGRNAGALAERVGPGDPLPLRYRHHGAAGDPGAHGQPLAAGLPGGRPGADQSGGGPPAFGFLDASALRRRKRKQTMTTAITLDELVALGDEIGALVRAGVPLEQGLADLGGDLPGRLGQVATTLAEETSRGQPLAEVLARQTEQLPAAYRAVVQAGMCAAGCRRPWRASPPPRDGSAKASGPSCWRPPTRCWSS